MNRISELDSAEIELDHTKGMLDLEKEDYHNFKKRYKFLFIFGIIGLLFSMAVAHSKESMMPIDVFNISLIVCVLFKAVNDYTLSSFRYKSTINSLEYKIERCEDVINTFK